MASQPKIDYTQSEIHFQNYHKRFPKSHKPKIINAKNQSDHFNLDTYLIQKNRTQPDNSLNFESEMYVQPKKSNLIATEPYRRTWNHPWKYSYKTRDYQTCTEQFRRVRSTMIDLSKY